MQLTAAGELTIANGQRNLAGFDYQLYLKTQKIAGILTLTNYQQTKASTKLTFKSLHKKILVHLDTYFPSRLSSYIKALLFGYYDTAFQETRNLYSSVGLIQLVSLSGIQISLLLRSFDYILRRGRFLPVYSFVFFCCISIFSLIMCGNTVPVLRATLVFLLIKLKKIINWQLSQLDSFALVLLVSLLIKPFLFFSIAGVFSFVIYFMSIQINQLNFRHHQQLKKNLLLQLCFIPLLGTTFFEVPLLMAVFSLLLVPLLKFVLIPSSLLLFSLSFLKNFRVINILSSFSTEFLISTEYLLKVFKDLALPISFVSNEQLLFLMIAISFLFFGFKTYKKSRLLLLMLMAMSPFYQSYLNGSGLMAFIDVGQGDSIYLEAPFKKETVLIDTGGQIAFEQADWQKRKSQPSATYNLIPFLKSRGLRSLDHLILTHADEDHLGEAETLLKNFKVKNLYLANGLQKNPKLTNLLKDFRLRGGQLHLVEAGHQIGEYFNLQVLYPRGEVVGENNDSLVLGAKIKDQRILLTGDLEQSGEQTLLNDYPSLKADILKVGHHGSRTSTSKEFLQVLEPSLAIITCGQNNRFGHPHQDVLDNLRASEVLRTDRDGMIYFTWNHWQDFRRYQVVEATE